MHKLLDRLAELLSPRPLRSAVVDDTAARLEFDHKTLVVRFTPAPARLLTRRLSNAEMAAARIEWRERELRRIIQGLEEQ